MGSSVAKRRRVDDSDTEEGDDRKEVEEVEEVEDVAHTRPALERDVDKLSAIR